MLQSFISKLQGNINIKICNSLPAEYERKQVRFPKSKKKRIRKKWAKQAKNYAWKEVPKIFLIGNVVLISPKFYSWFLKLYKKFPL